MQKKDNELDMFKICDECTSDSLSFFFSFSLNLLFNLFPVLNLSAQKKNPKVFCLVVYDILELPHLTFLCPF